jgi:predicted ATPase
MTNLSTTLSTTILTPDQRLRVFVSSTLQELAEERKAAKTAITELRLNPVMFELGARAHPPRALYRAYLEQSHIFVGIYWQRYGWVAPGETISGLEDEYQLSGSPKLIYVKTPANEREDRLKTLLKQIQSDDQVSYKSFSTPRELQELLENDLALLLTERFAASLFLERAQEPQRVPVNPEYVLPPSNLPESPTPLIGREVELQKISSLLEKQEVRLVTLTGPGGVGKTRLGLEVAKRLHGVFRDGVYFVGLSAVTDPALVLPTIAKVLEIPENKTLSSLESLKHHLEHKQLLLVLDNFEQVTEAAPALSELLSEAPGLELLVTSRSPLRISAEYVCVVPPLTLPHGGRSPLEAIRATEAVRLFTDRAKAAKADFELTVDNALAVAEICYRLDGLPLAIELAAARVPLLTPQAILKRLDKRFDLLKGGARDLPTRQQTLKNTIDWSFQLLSEVDKRLFTRLAIFASSSSLEAIEALNQDDKDINVLEGLASLVEKSLLKQTEVAGEPRFKMLETIREFALVKLQENNDSEALQKKHAQYFLGLAETSAPFIKKGDKTWLDKLELEHDNFRSALRWATVHDVELGLRLGVKLTRFWWTRGFTREGRSWLDALLAQAQSGEAAKYRAHALHSAGTLAWMQSDFAAAEKNHAEALEMFRHLKLEDGMADALNGLAIIAIERGELAKSRALQEETIALRKKLDDKSGLAASLSNLGLVEGQEGDLLGARAHYQEALKLQQDLGDTWGSVTTYINLAGVAYHLGEFKEAETYSRQALTIAADIGDKESVAYALEGFGALATAQKDYTRAARVFGAASALREATNNPLPPSGGRDEYDQLVSTVREKLGDETMTASWTEGRALSLDKAIALALQTAPQTAAPTSPS